MKNNIIPFLMVLFIGIGLNNNKAIAQMNIQKVNTDIFPEAEKGYKKVVIEVPYSEKDAHKKIEFFAGKMMEVDGCNHFSLQGQLEQKDLSGWGYSYYVFKTNGQVTSTMMGCPDQAKRNLFVSARPLLQDYNGRMPIVIYVPEDYDVKFKIYTSDNDTYQAAEVPKKAKK